jgi:antitoxin (DNA-binding transcriptional repressor) of toxin-antitoxin stability system
MKYIDSNPHPKTIGFRELRENSDAIVNAVASGDSFLVKRKSKAVFRIVPVEEEAWNVAIDFTEIHPNGVPIQDVIDVMENMKKKNPEKYGRQDRKISR